MDIKKFIEQIIAALILLALALVVLFLSIRYQPAGAEKDEGPAFYRWTAGGIRGMAPK